MGKMVWFISLVLCETVWANSTICLTRKDCNSTESEVCHQSHFMLDFDSDGGFGISGHGTCAQCGDLPLKHCFAPCYVERNGLFESANTTCSADTLSFVLNLDWQIPFYLGGFFGLTKLVFSFVVLTPTKPGTTTSNTTKTLRVLSLVFLVMGIASDLEKIVVAFTDPSMSWWQAVQSIALIWLSSSNMPATAAATAMIFSGAVAPLNVVVTTDLGQTMFKGYLHALVYGYFFPGMIFAVWSIPAFVIYGWLSIPLLILARCCGVVLGPIVARMVIGITGEKHLDNFESKFKDSLKNAIEESEENPVLERMKAQIKKSASIILKNPMDAILGVDDKPMEAAIVMVLVVPLLSIFVTAQARLLDDYGYVESLYLTLTERHVATYLNLSRQNSLHLANLIWLFI